MNSNSHSDHNLPADDRELDKLLENSCFVAVPADFERNVLQAIASVPQSKAPVVRWWQWLALLGGRCPVCWSWQPLYSVSGLSPVPDKSGE